MKDIRPGAVGSDPRALLAFNGVLYFGANDGVSGRELWRSDGTSSGTRRVGDFIPGSESLDPRELTRLNDDVFFFTSEEDTDDFTALWVSDGTPGGTRPLREINPGADSSVPIGFTLSGWDVFFFALDASHGRELWALPFRPEDECDDSN